MNIEHEDELEPLEGRVEAVAEAGGMSVLSVLGIVLVALSLGFVIYDGLESETYFYTVDAAVAQGTDLSGQRVRVKGTVEPGSIVGADGTIERRFRIMESGKSLKVSYDRAMPDTFADNVEVVVEGEVSDDMVIVASEVLVKCPSRYEGNPPTAHDPTASL
jgi:cytochrome c-type biogenesis protein CcmE